MNCPATVLEAYPEVYYKQDVMHKHKHYAVAVSRFQFKTVFTSSLEVTTEQVVLMAQ